MRFRGNGDVSIVHKQLGIELASCFKTLNVSSTYVWTSLNGAKDTRITTLKVHHNDVDCYQPFSNKLRLLALL